MPARDALIFASVEKKPNVLPDQFPKPGFLLTDDWRKLSSTAILKPPLELRDLTWSFLAVQNFTKTSYTDVSIGFAGGAAVPLGGLDPDSTVFLYCTQADCADAKSARYKLFGTTELRENLVPPLNGTPIRVLSTLDIRRLGSLSDLSDRVMALIRSKGTPPE
jgi:hypothetical protein